MRIASLGLSILLAAGAASAQYEAEPTRATMRELFAQMQFLLPLSVNGDLSDPAHRDAVRAALTTVAESAALLEDHSRGFDPAAQRLGQGLARDARRTLELYDRGAYETSAFYIQHLSENCVGCHARLEADDSPVAQGFLADEAGLDPLERARFQIATRQFEAALASYEEVFAATSVSPGTLLGPLIDYLTVCVRVEHDLERPRVTLQKFAQRPGIWKQLREDLDAWTAALGRYTRTDLESDDLETARALVERARTATRYPGDHRALVDFLVASAQLHHYVAEHREPSASLAEAYYLLGTAELAIGRDFWISKTSIFLETSIRVDPSSSWADQAYALLEQETLAGYTGSGGLRLPDDERQHLEELRSLVETH